MFTLSTNLAKKNTKYVYSPKKKLPTDIDISSDDEDWQEIVHILFIL